MASWVKELGRDPSVGVSLGEMEHKSRSRKLPFAHAPLHRQVHLSVTIA